MVQKTRNVLAAVFLASLFPFVLIELCHTWFYHVMDVTGYLVFHNIAEFFSVMVSMSIFGVGWFTYDRSSDRHVLFLSAAFFAIGLIDFMHALGYAGMPAFITPNSANKSTQYWIAVRFLAASALLASAFIYPGNRGRWLSRPVLILAALLIPAAVFTGITFFPASVPATFIQGAGLTPFKKISEYVIIFLLAAAFIAYWKRMLRTGDRQILWYLAAFILCIFSELVFAVYRSVFDTYNVLGHIYKVIAFFLIYKGIFASAVNNPYVKLAESNEILRNEIAERERATAERLRMLEELREKERLLILQSRQAAMGEMVGNIAHQWRQPLNALSLIMHYIEDSVEEGNGERAEIARHGMDLIHHLSHTIDDFRNFFRPDFQMTRFNLKERIDKTLVLASHGMKAENIQIEVDVRDDVIATGYPNEYCQVLLNILNNAVDALEEKNVQSPRIRVRAFAEGSMAVTTITDNAGGIADSIIGRIFDPYFTTKSAEKGTGIGLYMSRAIIEERMNGTISARNLEEGAEFRVEIPVSE